MKFYRGNRADEVPFEVSVEEIVGGFLASKWADYPWALQRSLMAFLTDPDGPVNGTCEAPDFDKLLDAVQDKWLGQAR